MTRIQNLLVMSLVLLTTFMFVHRLQFIVDVATRPSHSFVNYYTASYLLMNKANVSQYYDDTWYMAHTAKITPGIEDIYTPHPPTTALLLLPLAHLSHADARIIWIILSLVLVIGAVVWILWAEQLSRTYALLSILVVLSYQPMVINFKYGQIYGLLFVGMTVIWYSYQHNYHRLTSISLGVMLIFKTAGLLLIPFFVMKRCWKLLMWSSLTIGMIGLISLPIVGIQSWLTFTGMLPDYSHRPSFAVTAYQSIAGFFNHHFLYHPIWNPSPLINAPELGNMMTWIVTLVLLVVTFWKAKQTNQPKLLFCALVVLGVIISPVTLDYHYAVLMLPILLLLAHMPSMSVWQKLWFLVAIFLLAVDYPYQKSLYDTTFLSIMAYPKLCGGFALWSLIVKMMSDNQSHAKLDMKQA